MLFCQNWCPECGKPSTQILTKYKGRLICRFCKTKLEEKSKVAQHSPKSS